jgi:transcriptional regulator with XRE-family HTH domain
MSLALLNPPAQASRDLRSPEFDSAAKRVAWLRMKHNLTLEDFGRRCGYHGSHISRIEKGMVKPVRRFVLMVCEAFNVREEWLLRGEGAVYGEPASPEHHRTVEGDIVDTLVRTVQHVATLPPGGRRLAARALHEMVDMLCDPDGPEMASHV